MANSIFFLFSLACLGKVQVPCQARGVPRGAADWPPDVPPQLTLEIAAPSCMSSAAIVLRISDRRPNPLPIRRCNYLSPPERAVH